MADNKQWTITDWENNYAKLQVRCNAFEKQLRELGEKAGKFRTERDGLQLRLDAAEFLRDKRISALEDVVKVQCSEGNWNYDPYMHGMANGLILAMAIMADKDPVFFEAPKVWVEKSGTVLIEQERIRQRDEEEFDAEHDDEHTDGSMAVVAATLAVDGTDAYVVDQDGRGSLNADNEYTGDCWGLVAKHGHHAKPTTEGEIRKLVIAGSLIAAEIDRVLRIAKDDNPLAEAIQKGKKNA